MSTVDLVVNGEPRRFEGVTTLADLLGALKLDRRSVVVEHNRVIVRREGLEGARVEPHDTIEIVHFVGGG